MSRVDDNSDAQRIKEMNEAQLRQKADNRQRATQARTEKAFQRVMSERSGRTAAQQQAAKQAEPGLDAREAARRVLQQVRQDAPKDPRELARRAAMSRAMHGDLQGLRSKDAQQAETAEAGRATELVEGSELESTHVDRTARDEEHRELDKAERRQAEVEQAAELGGALSAVGDDTPRRDRQSSGGDGRRDDAPAQGVARAKGAAGASPTQIPPEVLKQIVGAVYKAVSQDGRTHMHVTLRGGMLDGVQLQIRAENGKVSCDFSGCGKDLSRLLDGAKGALARGLSRRGLRLERLSAR